MARSHANFCGKHTPVTAQADYLRWTLAVYPLRQLHRSPLGEALAGQVSQDPWPFSLAEQSTVWM